MSEMDHESGLGLTFQCGLYRDKVMLPDPTTMPNLKQQAMLFLARKYPNHPYINLASSVSFSVLSPDGEGLDKPLECVADMHEDCVVNICLTNRAQTSRTVINPHTLAVKSYRSPAFCDFCGQMLFGLVRQGLNCSGCGYNFHKRCAYRIPNNCPGFKPPPQPKTPKRAGKKPNSVHSNSSLSSSSSYTLPSQRSVDLPVNNHHHTWRRSLTYQPNSFDHSSLQSAPSVIATSPVHSQTNSVTSSNKPPKRSNSYVGRPVWIDRAIAKCEIEVPHTFAMHNYKRPTICMHCRRLLVGLRRQGMQCKDCKYNVHRGCVPHVPKNCQSQILDELTSGRPKEHSITLTENGSQSESAKDDGDASHDDCVAEEDMNLGTDAENDEDTESVHSAIFRTDSKDSKNSANIPLQRVYVSKPQSDSGGQNSRGTLEPTKEGWMVCFSTLKKMRELYYWKLDSRSLHMFSSPKEHRATQSVALSSMLAISVPTKAEPISPNTTAHCFEFPVGREGVYYIGEKSTPEKSGIHSNSKYRFPADCGVTLEEALQQAVGEKLSKPWEEAIRNAFMPVTPKPSIKTVVSVTESASMMDDDTLSLPAAEAALPGEAALYRQYNSTTVDISVFYQIFSDECLGSGQFGVVYGGVHRHSGRMVAVKVIDKLRFPSKQERALKNEVAILHTLMHPGIVNLERMFETSDRIFVVMEKMDGDMLEMILRNQQGRLEERVTRFIIFQILTALDHLHQKNIVHCDLKPENVLLRDDSTYPQIKLCDFGFARIIGEKSFRRSVVGTPAYLAPEVLNNVGYDRSLDMWSVGVIIYVSLSGTFPFNEDEEIPEQIQNAAFMYPDEPWKTISTDAVDLISLLLRVDKGKRCTARQALLHPFLSSRDTWHDCRTLERELNERYLTHPAEEQYMMKEAPAHSAGSITSGIMSGEPVTKMIRESPEFAAPATAVGTERACNGYVAHASGVGVAAPATNGYRRPSGHLVSPVTPDSVTSPAAAGSIMIGRSGYAAGSASAPATPMAVSPAVFGLTAGAPLPMQRPVVVAGGIHASADPMSSRPQYLTIVGEQGKSSELNIVGEQGKSSELNIVGEQGKSSELNIVGEQGKSSELNIVGEQGKSSDLNIIGEQGTSQPAANLSIITMQSPCDGAPHEQVMAVETPPALSCHADGCREGEQSSSSETSSLSRADNPGHEERRRSSTHRPYRRSEV